MVDSLSKETEVMKKVILFSPHSPLKETELSARNVKYKEKLVLNLGWIPKTQQTFDQNTHSQRCWL